VIIDHPDGDGIIGFGGDNNRVLVSDPGSLWSISNKLAVAHSGSFNRLTVSNGAKVVAHQTLDAVGGMIGGSSNTNHVTGSGSELDFNPGELAGRTFAVGGGATISNTLMVSQGGSVRVGGALVIEAGNAVYTTGGFLRVSGTVTNSGTLQMISSVGTFTGPVVNNGAWITDPTTNIFQSTYTLGTHGFIQMGAGDVFIFTNGPSGPASFLNQSTHNVLTDMTKSEFLFKNMEANTTQRFEVAGINYGPDAPTPTSPVTGNWLAVSTTNFALGTMRFPAESFFDIFVELDVPGSNPFATNNALYVEDLFLGDNANLIIRSNVTVYFLNSNDWGGATFTLEGNAGLHQFFNLAVIPEPSVLLLWLSGGAVICVARFRKRKKL
jgi:T5SS/PEP-CTERM-associated repeat protein